MPRIVPLLVGLGLATAVTYKFRNDLIQDQNKVKKGLEEARTTLERAVTKEQQQQPSYMTDSQKYVTHRLIPSVKDNWNNQIRNASQSLVKMDVGSKAKKLWDHGVNNVNEWVDSNKK